MPQPAAVDQVAQQLARQFQAAQTSIERQLASFPSARRAAKLRDLQRTVNALLDQLEADMRAWIETQLPEAYALGAADAAGAIGDSFVWNQPHVEALNSLALTSWDDMLAATRFVRRDVKQWIRTEARQQATLSLIEGRTARQAGQALADAAAGDLGLFTVTYRNGARVRLADYADMALRTTTANAYAEGTLNQSRQLGVKFMECADGSDCGLTSHDDAEKPNGNVYPIRVAEMNPLAHPRCRRSWIPRIDATSTKTPSLRDDKSIADQRAFEQRQASVSPRGRAPRQPRSSSTPRTPRTPRATPAPPKTGVPASTALSSRPSAARSDVGREVQRGLDAIDKVHRIPEGLRPVPVSASTASTYYGRYTHQLGPTGAPVSIRIKRDGDHKASTFAHEFGHYLDHQALGPQPGSWGTRNLKPDTPMYAWAKAVDASPTVQALRTLPKQDSLSRYYQRGDELWARSYAQYVATRSGDTAMLTEIAAIRDDSHAGRALSQWTAEEFEPIARTIDEMLAGLGLLA